MQLVNIQSNTEFASHRLNRDTWAVPTLQDIVRGSFIFLQVRCCLPSCVCPVQYKPLQWRNLVCTTPRNV